MRQMHRHIPGWVGLATLLAVLTIVAVGCGEEDDPVVATPPVFSVTPVSLEGAYNAAAKRLGDVSFAESSPVLLPFGALLEFNRVSSALEYYTIPGAPVRAVCTGIITAIIANPVEEGDYEIWVTVLPGSDYTVIYDHVLDVQTLEGIQIEAGDTLGIAGTWSDSLRRLALQVRTGEGVNRRYYCPLNYGDTAFFARHERLLESYHDQGVMPHYDTLCLLGSIGPGN